MYFYCFSERKTAILAKFCHFSAKIAPHVEISIILAGFYVEKTIIFPSFGIRNRRARENIVSWSPFYLNSLTLYFLTERFSQKSASYRQTVTFLQNQFNIVCYLHLLQFYFLWHKLHLLSCLFSHFAKKSNNLDFPERRIPVITLISDVPDPFQRV